LEFLLMQLPGDLAAWIETVNRYAPRVIVETGTCGGSTTAFLADCLRRRHPDGRYRVVTVEINAAALNKSAIDSDPNIVSIVGSSVDPEIIERVRAAASIGDDAPIMVTLDSDHEPLHICKEMEAYTSLVTPGQHLVVQDTRLSVSYNYHHGPLGAVEALLQTDPRWEINFFPERFPSSQYPFGWLRRRV
jgi:cephalosporin hydroxylase